VFKKSTYLFAFLFILALIPLKASAMSVQTNIGDNISVIVTDFVAPLTLEVTQNDMIIYSETRDDGNFNFPLNNSYRWGTAQLLITDGNGATTTSSLYFDGRTSPYQEITTPPPSPSPTPNQSYTLKLEFPVDQNYFYSESYKTAATDPLDENYTKRVETDMDVNTIFNDRNDRILIPVRYFAESLGYTVNWNESTRTVSIVSLGTSVSMQVGSDYLINNNNIIKMDEPLQIQNGRTYLPIRFVGEAFGFNVYWDTPSKTALLYK